MIAHLCSSLQVYALSNAFIMCDNAIRELRPVPTPLLHRGAEKDAVTGVLFCCPDTPPRPAERKVKDRGEADEEERSLL